MKTTPNRLGQHWKLNASQKRHVVQYYQVYFKCYVNVLRSSKFLHECYYINPNESLTIELPMKIDYKKLNIIYFIENIKYDLE